MSAIPTLAEAYLNLGVVLRALLEDRQAAVEFREEIFAQTRANEESARRMDQASKGLLKQSAGLREDVHRFQL